MTNPQTWIPDDEWRTTVANVSLVSVDLVIEHDDGMLFGKRENEPTKGDWFVPDGGLIKDESWTDAVHCAAEAEIGESVIINDTIVDF
jgi:colanic acid biosynthesis protein WcaH